MATVESNKTIVVLGRESGSYGNTQTTPDIKLPDMMEYTFGVAGEEVTRKTQTLEPQMNETYEGRKSPTVTLSGVLTYSHRELLTALTGVTGDTYTWQTSDVAAGSAGHSYTIVQAIPEGSGDLGSGIQATGCRLESLEISRDGNKIGYTATFRAKAIVYVADLSGWTLTNITNTSYPELTPFLWHDVTCAILGTNADTSLNTFSLTLTNEFADDDVAFQNSQTKTSDYICGVSGSLTAEWIHDNDLDDDVYGNLYSQDTQQDVITLISGSYEWAFTTWGQYTEYSKPDKEKCLFTSSFTKRLAGDSTDTALSIAITEPA